MVAASEAQRTESASTPVTNLIENPGSGGPTVLRILLGAQLRRLRENKRISLEEAGNAIRASHSKISRLETGRVGFKDRDIADLLTLYGVTDETERQSMRELAARANRPGWWHDYSDILPSWFEAYVGLEEAASQIRAYEVQFVPGVLQTGDYARAVTVLGHPTASERELDRRVKLRLSRQVIFTRAQPPNVWAVLDEAVLRRPLGGAEIMRGQLKHLTCRSGRMSPSRSSRSPRAVTPPLAARSASCASPSSTCLTWSTWSSSPARCTWTSRRWWTVT
jgi:transcriptional regulator with XRE-family HTH domain